MRAEYQAPDSIPDVPSMPDTDLPEIPADPTSPAGDPEPQGRLAANTTFVGGR
jgi:hypothetical protein